MKNTTKSSKATKKNTATLATTPASAPTPDDGVELLASVRRGG